MLLPQVEAALKSKGCKVSRPPYDSTSGTEETESKVDTKDKADSEDEVEKKPSEPAKSSNAKSKLDKFKHKANHEATSDEDD